MTYSKCMLPQMPVEDLRVISYCSLSMTTVAEEAALDASDPLDDTHHARLLYYNLHATPYPTNSSSNLLAIRFAAPVRIASLRITPEGVESIDGIGWVHHAALWARLNTDRSSV